ncbi:hypothetical protein ACUSIJ_25030 [Pseudochelatococcus sp. B33]
MNALKRLFYNNLLLRPDLPVYVDIHSVGRMFFYPVLAHDVKWHRYEAVYIVARPDRTAIYVGQARDLYERLRNHERIHDFQHAGGTYVYALRVVVPGAAYAIEKLLIEQLQPLLNTQHVR